MPEWNAWPDEHKTHAVEKWRAGFSASQVSKSLHDTFKAHYSRNAVIGVMHRLGEAKRDGKSRQNPSAPRRTYPSKPLVAVTMRRAAPPPIAPLPATPAFIAPVNAFKPLPGSAPRPLAGLTFGVCRWPVDVPGAADQHFCCRPVANQDSEFGSRRIYCEAHAPRAVSAADAKKTKNLARSLRHYA